MNKRFLMGGIALSLILSGGTPLKADAVINSVPETIAPAPGYQEVPQLPEVSEEHPVQIGNLDSSVNYCPAEGEMASIEVLFGPEGIQPLQQLYDVMDELHQVVLMVLDGAVEEAIFVDTFDKTRVFYEEFNMCLGPRGGEDLGMEVSVKMKKFADDLVEVIQGYGQLVSEFEDYKKQQIVPESTRHLLETVKAGVGYAAG